MIISHEVCHGFDDRGIRIIFIHSRLFHKLLTNILPIFFIGRQSDGNGNLLDWWDKATVNQYVEKANCFTHQYSKYQVAENLTVLTIELIIVESLFSALSYNNLI